MKPRTLVDSDLSYIDMGEDQMRSLWHAYYPAGSGPLGAMRTICALLENIAHIRGIDTSTWGKMDQS